ncbi:transposase family protein [Leptolyngbya sp. PCC 6406]|uniref:transposase family protein n=1 Tax=Leptolyngbya sp. PCC 6406 TaxID=1173264 RepID=UPI0002AC8596|nr:transposase family protein [Leptolyngbya sp. PCC 6406]
MTLIEQLKQIPDHRHLRGRRHPLWMLLILSLLGFLCGYRGYRPLADFAQQHEAQLRELHRLADAQPMPSYSTLRRTTARSGVSPQSSTGSKVAPTGLCWRCASNRGTQPESLC